MRKLWDEFLSSKVWYLYIAVCLVVVLFGLLIPSVAYSQGNWGSYNTKYEYDSIRNQERIIRLLEDHNRSCK